MLLAAGLADVRADLDDLRARLDSVVATAGGTRAPVPAPRAPGPSEGEPLVLTGGGTGARSVTDTARAIALGLELPVLARRRFLASSGSALEGVGRKSHAGDSQPGRHPATKVSALWRADLADDLAWRYSCDSHAWGYASLRWLLVDSGGTPTLAPDAAVESSASGRKVGARDVARLRAVVSQASEAARRPGARRPDPRDSGTAQARHVLVRQLSADADRILHGRRGAQVNRELLAAAAEATLLAGCLTYSCWPSAALAQAYFVQALALAQACDDRQLGAAVLCAMSRQATFTGHVDEARNLASTALRGTRGVVPPGLSVHIRLLTARDHICRNELTPCVRALKDAATESDHSEAGGKPGWTEWFTEADPLLFALVLAAAYEAAGLPGAADDTHLIARQLAERAPSPCSAGYFTELDHQVAVAQGARLRPRE